ncbi:MAG: putative immunity protein [Acholeplasmataceae bacterium]
MRYNPAIRIDDIKLLAYELFDAYSKLNHEELMHYALALIDHVLDYTNYTVTPLITSSIETLKAYMNKEITLKTLRDQSFKCHEQARLCKKMVERNIYRVIGQAIATAHVKLHALRASDYMIKIVNLMDLGNVEKIGKERRYQISLMEHIKSQRKD